MPTLYALKPAFQARLRPLADRLARAGVTANQITLLAAALSVATGIVVAAFADHRPVFLLMPVVLFLRMALNAIDGMLAREHAQASTLGMYLNELCDVVSDLALILAFAAVFPAWGVVAFAIAAIIAEYAGVLGVAAGTGPQLCRAVRQERPGAGARHHRLSHRLRAVGRGDRAVCVSGHGYTVAGDRHQPDTQRS